MELTRTLPADDAEALRRLVEGRVAAPTDPDFEALRAGWNLTVEQRPMLVAEAVTPEDVEAAVAFARERELTVTVQNTGHGAGEVCGGGLLLRTGRLRGVEVDAASRIARVGGGVLWMDLLPSAHEGGLAPLLGFNPYLGVVGSALGGGIGWLGRKHGLAVDSVRALEAVLPEGERVRVGPEREPELFWALRGGSSNFGVVVAMELELVPLEPGRLYGGAVVYPPERAADVLAAYADWFPALPDEVQSGVAIARIQRDGLAPASLRGVTAVIVSACVLADQASAEELLAPMRELGDPLDDFFRPLTIGDLGTVTVNRVDPMPTHGHSVLVHDLTPELQDLLAATADEGHFAVVELRHLGGAYRRGDTSGPIARPSGELLVHAEALVPEGPAGIAADAALSRLATRLRPLATGEMLPSFLGECETGPERIAQAYTAEARGRLATLKRRYDPGHRFRFGRCVDLSWALD